MWNEEQEFRRLKQEKRLHCTFCMGGLWFVGKPPVDHPEWASNKDIMHWLACIDCGAKWETFDGSLAGMPLPNRQTQADIDRKDKEFEARLRRLLSFQSERIRKEFLEGLRTFSEHCPYCSEKAISRDTCEPQDQLECSNCHALWTWQGLPLRGDKNNCAGNNKNE